MSAGLGKSKKASFYAAHKLKENEQYESGLPPQGNPIAHVIKKHTNSFTHH
jgi:hypothetical protein